MSKIALCLSGKVGNTKGKSGYYQSEYKVLKKGYDHYKKHIIDVNDIDVFVHCWDTELEDDINSLYKPKDIIVEKQVIFDIPNYVKGEYQRKQNHYSRGFSNMKVNNLCCDFSQKNNIKYDFVMTTRFDLAFETDIIFDDYDTNKFYAGRWTSVNYNGQDLFKGGRGPLYDIINRQGKDCLKNFKFATKGYPNTHDGFLDLWFFANYKNSKKFNDMYYNLDEYTKPDKCPTDSSDSISNHQLVKYHLERLCLLDQVEFILDMYDDFPEVRRKYYGCRK
mgnify:FL=1